MKLRLKTGNGETIKTVVKKKFQFTFPVNEKYLEIDRDFIWTGFARYGFRFNPVSVIVGVVDDSNGYDERVDYASAPPAISLPDLVLPNFFDFQLYINGRKLFSKLVNLCALPTVQHMMELPCGYYLPKGTKIYFEAPFVGSYFPATPTPGPNALICTPDSDFFESKNIQLLIDGYEVEEINRDVVETLERPYFYVVGGYWAGYYDPQNTPPLFVPTVQDWELAIEAMTEIPWPRENDNVLPLEDEYFRWYSANKCPISYENDCIITKVWRYDWEYLICITNRKSTVMKFEQIIYDEHYQWPYKPTRAIGAQPGGTIIDDIIRFAPRFYWKVQPLAGFPTVLNNLIQYCRVQLKSYKQKLSQMDSFIHPIFHALHIGMSHSPTVIKPQRRHRFDVDTWEFRMDWDEWVKHTGLVIGSQIGWQGENPLNLTAYNVQLKRLIIVGVKEFARTTINKKEIE